MTRSREEDTTLHQMTETKNVRLSIPRLQEEMESHMTFYLELENQDPGKVQQDRVSSARTWTISKGQCSENSKLLECFACTIRVPHYMEEGEKSLRPPPLTDPTCEPVGALALEPVRVSSPPNCPGEWLRP